MLFFEHPASLGRSLNDTYKYLLPTLGNILGYPIALKTFSPRNAPTIAALEQDDGSLLIRLPGPKLEIGRTYLELPKLAAEDKYCRQIAARFTKSCMFFSVPAKKSWDLKAYLIRDEQFLWDNTILSVSYRGNQKYNALDFFGTARETARFRYENVPVRLGVLATWNWHQLKPQLAGLGCTILHFDPPFDLRDRLRINKSSHLLTDGLSSFYVITSGGAVISWISIPQARPDDSLQEWESVAKAYRSIRKILVGRDLVLTVNEQGELFFFNRENVLKWNHSGWHRVVGPPMSNLLKPFVSADVARRLIATAVELSERRHGALIVITSKGAELLEHATRGTAEQFKERPLFRVTDIDLNTFCRLAQIDGAVIVDAGGFVLNAGVILEVPKDHSAAGQGARTAAAGIASCSGIVIKVSHDGPISVFLNGAEVRRMG